MATSKLPVPPSSMIPATAARAEEMALVERCRRGDLAAFEELYKAHAGKLFSVACRMVGNQADAEDLLQEIFLSAHRKLDGFRVNRRWARGCIGSPPIPAWTTCAAVPRARIS